MAFIKYTSSDIAIVKWVLNGNNYNEKSKYLFAFKILKMKWGKYSFQSYPQYWRGIYSNIPQYNPVVYTPICGKYSSMGNINNEKLASSIIKNIYN